jgi:hypothetical protein
MRGHVLVAADALIEIRDLLVKGDSSEAYHVLRMQADPTGSVYRNQGDHWANWNAIAAVCRIDREAAEKLNQLSV